MSSWVIADNAHDILFKKSGDSSYKNSLEDFGLFPTNRPVILPAKAMTNFVEVPGMNGSLDYTEALRDKVVKSYNTGTWDFQLWKDSADWYVLYSALLAYFDGSEFSDVYLEDDPTHKYKGHIRVSDFKSPSPGMPTVQLTYDLIKK